MNGGSSGSFLAIGDVAAFDNEVDGADDFVSVYATVIRQGYRGNRVHLGDHGSVDDGAAHLGCAPEIGPCNTIMGIGGKNELDGVGCRGLGKRQPHSRG